MECKCKFFPVIILCLSFNLYRNARSSPVDVFSNVLELVSPGEGYLDEMAVGSFFNLLEKRVHCAGVSCEKCLFVESVGQLVANFTSPGGLLRKEGFFRLAAALCLYLSSPSETCSAVRAGRWWDETDHLIRTITGRGHDEPGKRGGNGKSGIQTLIGKVGKHYKHNHQYNQRCLTAQDILDESNTSMTDGGPHAMDAVFGHLIYHALLGDCLTARPLPEEDYFLTFIFNRFGTGNVTVDGLAAIMKSLHLGGYQDGEDHGDHQHRGDEDVRHDDHVRRDHGAVIGSRRGGPETSERDRREEHRQGNGSWDLMCFSPEEMVQIHGLNGSGLSRSDIARISPALVQQLLSGSCGRTSPPIEPSDQLSTTEKYLYASLANLLICLIAMVGIVMLLCTSCSSVFQLVLQFSVSLAVGSLTGDALLHLLPMFLGLHLHAEETDHGHSEETPDYVYKILVLLAGIYYFYLMEAIFSIVTTTKNSHRHRDGEESEPDHCDHAKVLEMYVQDKKNKHSASQTDLVDGGDAEKAFPEPNHRTKEQRLLPYMVTMGDAIHNFADGLALGAAFSVSWRSGLATSLAVFCHELPHELGDFAILLHSGLSVKKALVLNVGSALTSFIGLYIALTISTDLATKQWIAAITAGLFLYVGLADMLPTMVHANSRRPWLTFLIQNIGLLSGWGILLVLSLYEDKIGF